MNYWTKELKKDVADAVVFETIQNGIVNLSNKFPNMGHYAIGYRDGKMHIELGDLKLEVEMDDYPDSGLIPLQ